eukprot:g2639.t1
MAVSLQGCNFVQQTSDIAPPLPKVILGMLMEIIFSIMWPLVTEVGENQMGAIFDNIVFPFVVYWAMSGLERLAEMMENPVGDDDTDINLLQQLHELEVGAQLAFELAEKRRSALRRTRCEDLGSRLPQLHGERQGSAAQVATDGTTTRHYLAFRSVLTSNLGAGELTRQALWRKRMVHLMGQDHPAAELLQTDSQDTARSVLLRPIMGPRPRKHHVSEALMQAAPRGVPKAQDAEWTGFGCFGR